jgi:deoxyribodipyrimidine photo-lyase
MAIEKPVLVWFRQDLRLGDNPALAAAVAMQAPVVPVYILDDVNAGDFRQGAASRWWLHHSLTALNKVHDDGLLCLEGDAEVLLLDLAADIDARAVFWNRCYEPWRIARDKRIKSRLRDAGREVHSFNGSMLFEPPRITNDDGTPYKVFTPFYRRGCLGSGMPVRKAGGAPTRFDVQRHAGSGSVDVLNLLPEIAWHKEMDTLWKPGERSARQRLDAFLASGIAHYKNGRNRPDKTFVSRLSAHLHFGEISPHTVWHAAHAMRDVDGIGKDVDHFLNELGWREFSHYLLYHWPTLPTQNLQKKFDRFPWREDNEALSKWQRGQTGYPIVDAGMRELWRTGYMHNRLRMIVGSFLVKNLLLDWRQGEAWFWDTLVDADLANNSAGWQWIAGSGADATSYFRVFNPVIQGKKFDPNGDYVRRYVPELAGVPDAFLHYPWEATEAVLAEAGVKLGETYPQPMIELTMSRDRALSAFETLTTD